MRYYWAMKNEMGNYIISPPCLENDKRLHILKDTHFMVSVKPNKVYALELYSLNAPRNGRLRLNQFLNDGIYYPVKKETTMYFYVPSLDSDVPEDFSGRMVIDTEFYSHQDDHSTIKLRGDDDGRDWEITLNHYWEGDKERWYISHPNIVKV